MAFVSGVLLAIFVILLWRLKSHLYKIYEEFFVVFHVMGGGEGVYRASDLSSMRVYPFVTRTELLDEAAIAEIHHFTLKNGADDISPLQLQAGILKFSHLVVVRDRVSGTLRGTLAFSFKREAEYTVFILGMLLLEPNYRKEMYMYLAPVFYILKERVFHPLTPLYVIGKAITYISYITGHKMFDEFYPTHERETPHHLQKIIDDQGESILGAGESYENGVIKRRGFVYKETLVVLGEEQLKNPHIKYYIERNPDWREGHALLCIAELSWRNIINVVKRGLSKAKPKQNSEVTSGPHKSAKNKKEIFIARNSWTWRKSTVSDILRNVDLDNI